MKAYKYKRSGSGHHWSMGFNETIIYIPELQRIIYNGTYSQSTQCGINDKEDFLKEAQEYVNDIKSNKISKYLNPHIEKWISEGKISGDISNPYKVVIHDPELEKKSEYHSSLKSTKASSLLNPPLDKWNDFRTYVKNIGGELGGGRISDYEEIEIEITEEEVKKAEEARKTIDGLKKYFNEN